MKLAWHVGVTEDGGGRVPDPQALWRLLEEYAGYVAGPDATVKLRFARFPSISTQPYMVSVNNVLVVQEVLDCQRDGFDGVLIGAATDSGVDEARSVAKIPVVGSIESALCMSEFIGRKVGIMTIGGTDAQLSYAQGMEGNAAKYALSGRLIGDRPVRPMPYSWTEFYRIFSAALAGDGEEFLRAFDSVSGEFATAGAEAVVCGNQFFGGVLHKLGRRAMTAQGLPYIDNAAAGLHMLKSLVTLSGKIGLRKSGIGTFRSPSDSLIAAVPGWLASLGKNG